MRHERPGDTPEREKPTYDWRTVMGWRHHHEQSQRSAAAAEAARQDRCHMDALHWAVLAASSETDALRMVPIRQPRTYTRVAVSALTLWLHAVRPDDAAQAMAQAQALAREVQATGRLLEWGERRVGELFHRGGKTNAPLTP